MPIQIPVGILIPFAATTLGSAFVYFLHRSLSDRTQRFLTGFAAGVMTAASIWSLLIPAIEDSGSLGAFAFLPAAAGFWLGILFLLFLDHVLPHLHRYAAEAEGPTSRLAGDTLMMLAVTIHNIPEGMAVGVVFAGLLYQTEGITLSSAMALSAGIAIQNLPEGAIVSMPLYASEGRKGKAFVSGMLSGAVEPVAAALTIALSGFLIPLMPYLLSFAAGAMLYVVVEELIPEMSHGRHSNIGVLAFAFGFTVMMALDVALG